MADFQLVGGKKLTELRVVDLRQELEKRGLEKSGVKAVLVERLQKALQAQAAEEDEFGEEKNDLKDEVELEPEDVEQEEAVENTTELNANSEIKSEPDSGVLSPSKRASAKPAKKPQKKKVTSEKETSALQVKKEEQEENSEDELSQESFDGEGVIMKIIDECQDDQGDQPEEMEIPDSTDVDELFKDESLNLNTEEDGEDKKDELGLSIKDSDLDMETGGEVKEEKNKDAVAAGSGEVPNANKDDIILGDNGIDSIKGETSAMDVSETDMSKDNGLSVSLFVHTDGVQDDLDEELKAAEKEEEEAAKDVKSEQKQESKAKEEENKDQKSKEVEKKDEKKEKQSETSEKNSKSEGKSSTDSKDTSKSSTKKTPDKKPSTAKKSTTDSKAKGAAATKEKKESGKSLWVSNLSSITRAADLKTRFSQHGKVVGAKIVTNSKAPGAQCFGLVTMSTSEEAAKCISHLHRTELHGRTITVDRAKGDRIPSQGGASATKKQTDKKQADKKADKSQVKGKADDKKQSDKGKKPNEKATKPSGKQSTGSSASASKKDETAQDDAKKSEDSSDRVVVMDDNKGEPVVVVPNKTEDSKSRSASRGRKSKSSEKSDGSPIKSLEEIRRQRVEKQRQDRAREMRDQRERERTLRIRRERERIARERAIEREREREREKERERRRQQFLREQRQKQEQERLRLQRELERRRELERVRREREERERLERERRERELILERERISRERIESERLKRIERERLERQRLERERVDRERLDRERLERLDRERRGSGIKRSAAPFERDNSASQRAGFWQDAKRAAVGGENREFFGGTLGSHDAVQAPRRSEDKVQLDRRESKGHRDDGRGHSRSGSRDGRRDDDFSRSDDRRRKDDHSRRGEVRDSRKDVRHVSDRDKGWTERMNANPGNLGPIDPQKSLSILLERAGVSGILGNNASGVRSDLGKGIDLDIGRSLSSDHRGSDWRQPVPRDSRAPVMSADHVSVGGRIDVRPSGVDARYSAMEHAHRPSAVAGEVKVTSREWHGDPSAELLASRNRPRGRGMDSKSAPHGYESRDRTVLPRDSGAQRGAWAGDSLHASVPPIPTRGLIDDRPRGSALPRDGVPPGWGSVGSIPVGDVRNAYSGGAGPDRRHSGGADVRYDPYKAAAQRSGGMRRY